MEALVAELQSFEVRSLHFYFCFNAKPQVEISEMRSFFHEIIVSYI